MWLNLVLVKMPSYISTAIRQREQALEVRYHYHDLAAEASQF
jgi:hypothetical protein